MTGALIGQKTQSGFIIGATIGAISGAVFSLEVYEYSLLLWHTNEPRSTFFSTWYILTLLFFFFLSCCPSTIQN
ncbi:hypothetical protein Syun_006423 [Stephania yunnanensis]|uniref:Uncharacterized protein n=1 Tax=Stephania yunnanensis TaxID=152371 RepID=A0AAP0KY77_9MAGN